MQPFVIRSSMFVFACNAFVVYCSTLVSALNLFVVYFSSIMLVSTCNPFVNNVSSTFVSACDS